MIDLNKGAVVSFVPTNATARPLLSRALRNRLLGPRASLPAGYEQPSSAPGPNVIPCDPDCGSYLGIYSVGGDQFWNWDMNQNTVPPTWDKKDWPITFVFYDRSEIDKVKDAIGWPRSGNTKYGRLNDGPQSNNAWLWDQDNGSKVSSCDDWHYRSYAPNPPDYMYNSSWGQYTLVTTHRDLNDCDNGLQAQYGWSETAEGNIAVRINNYVITQPQYSGWAMAQDAWNMGNGGFTSFWEGCCRYVQNNGMATRVDVFP